ncbi:MAG: hypothetical protein CM15mP120_22840 [Pseudomonadota bacterium]|nr:MAG: hypothetical protein CM15mP120_22840 [Pseudomonadota bacterium]
MVAPVSVMLNGSKALRDVSRAKRSGPRCGVGVSAMSGETNRLMAMGQQIGGDKPLPRELDVLLSSGEQVTIALLSMALMQLGVSAKSLLGDQVAVHTDSAFGKARIERIDTQRSRADLDQGLVLVVAGFQGSMGMVISRLWVVAGRIRQQSLLQQRYMLTSVKFVRMWTAYIPLTHASSKMRGA